jgi:hypothetical protein
VERRKHNCHMVAFYPLILSTFSNVLVTLCSSINFALYTAMSREVSITVTKFKH